MDLEKKMIEGLKKISSDKEQSKKSYALLASELDMNMTTLRKRFKEMTGQSLHQYVIHQKLEPCLQIMATSNKSITEIARDLGYSDVYYFSRQFTKIFGVSPSKYRDSMILRK